MKKKSLKVLLCSTLLAMALTVSACGEKDAGKDSAEVSSEKETQQEQEEKEVEKLLSCYDYKINTISPAVKSMELVR